MIERVKKDRVVFLTTHSMEEADVLADRIGVMADGQLTAIGSGLRLKKKYGKGMKLSLFAPRARHEEVGARVLDLWRELLPGRVIPSKAGASEAALAYQLPRLDDQRLLVPFFEALEDWSEAGDLGLTNLSVGLSTLEDVFLELSKQAEARAEARAAAKKAQREETRAPAAVGGGAAAEKEKGEKDAGALNRASLFETASGARPSPRSPSSPP